MELPDNVRALITSHIDSVIQLEVLLLLQGSPARQRTAVDVAKELRIDLGWVGQQLKQFCDGGLIGCGEGTGGGQVYTYTPRTPELKEAIDALAELYLERRVTVISTIFSKPVDPIRSFSDAFRLRRNKE